MSNELVDNFFFMMMMNIMPLFADCSRLCRHEFVSTLFNFCLGITLSVLTPQWVSSTQSSSHVKMLIKLNVTIISYEFPSTNWCVWISCFYNYWTSVSTCFRIVTIFSYQITIWSEQSLKNLHI